MAFTIPNIDEGIKWYCDELGCEFCQRFTISTEDNNRSSGFIMSMAGHPQPNSRLPRHNGLVFLDREEYFDVVNHCKNNPNINVIDSKYNFLIPKKIPPEEAHLHGQNVRCHRTTIKDPFDNWIEFKYYSYIEEIHSQRLDQIRRRNGSD